MVSVATAAPETPIKRPRGRPKQASDAGQNAASKPPAHAAEARVPAPQSPKKRGRRPGSKNKPKDPETASKHAMLKPGTPEKNGTRPKLPRGASQLQSSPVIAEPGAVSGSLAYSPMGHIPKLEISDTPERPVIERRSDGTVAFNEPAPAPPRPGISGHTLESGPPPKPKRQVGPRGRKVKPSARPDAVDEIRLAEKENVYRNTLQQVKREDVAAPSELREPSEHTRKKRGRPPLDSAAGPATPRAKSQRAEPSSRSAKRLKVISPKRPTALLVAPAAAPADDSDNNENDDFCATCGGTGIFICCESCPKSFHLLCCDPPLREVPEDTWSCNECLAAQGQVDKTSYNAWGMFGPLLNSVHGRNPAEFRLPRRLRDATFVDVSVGPEHKYTDASLKPDLSFAKMNGSQIAGFNVNADLEVDSLCNKNGVPYLCHKCKQSASGRRTMVPCDYCPLRWHLDCLPEPVCSAKTLGQKWRCPAHVESLLPDFLLERRSFRDAVVLDAAAHNKFLQFQLATNFLVKHSDQPYISDHKAPSLHEYMAYQKGDFFSNSTGFVARFHEQFGAQPEAANEDEVPEFKVPEFLQNYATQNVVVARGSRKAARILSMTNADDPDQKPFIYRVPEQSILLDFLHKRSGKADILRYIQHYETQQDADAERDMAAVGTLMEIQHSQSGAAAAAAAVPASAADELAIEAGELEELRAIKKLIQQKGKDAVLKSLQ